MKTIKYLFFVCIATHYVIAQSSIVYEATTIIEVQGGADICADIVTILGAYTGSGTLCNGPLPVELSVFTATVKNNVVMLYWKTETEVSNYGFEIHRRVYPAVGGTQNDKWVKIGFVEGHANSNSPQEYSFTDKKLIGGSKFQYRLKQVDTDGQFEYSDIVEVEIIPDKSALFQNYPNPFNPSTTIHFSVPSSEFVTLKVYDALGNEVATLVNEEKSPGSYKVDSNAAGLSSGIYFYKLQAGSFVEIKKMILLK